MPRTRCLSGGRSVVVAASHLFGAASHLFGASCGGVCLCLAALYSPALTPVRRCCPTQSPRHDNDNELVRMGLHIVWWYEVPTVAGRVYRAFLFPKPVLGQVLLDVGGGNNDAPAKQQRESSGAVDCALLMLLR